MIYSWSLNNGGLQDPRLVKSGMDVEKSRTQGTDYELYMIFNSGENKYL